MEKSVEIPKQAKEQLQKNPGRPVVTVDLGQSVSRDGSLSARPIACYPVYLGGSLEPPTAPAAQRGQS